MKAGDFIDLFYHSALAWIAMPCGSAPGLRRKKATLGAAACVLFAAVSLEAQSEHVFKGEVCLQPGGFTAALEKGEATAPCMVAHAKRGAKYVLANLENKTVYQLEAGRKPKAFAGSNVVVIGTLDEAARTIHVADIYRALPPKVTQAKSVYIDCDACPRGMGVAWLAAFKELVRWGRFDMLPDPKKADLILLISANPYLGDYVTRDGPDKRPVRVDITYMNVVDPQTGESFWDDSKQWGALFVAPATKDLIGEFKDELEFQEKVGKS